MIYTKGCLSNYSCYSLIELVVTAPALLNPVLLVIPYAKSKCFIAMDSTQKGREVPIVFIYTNMIVKLGCNHIDERFSSCKKDEL